ncbi:ZIP zinc transporter-domain-containing protein [Lipomyces chichibuensis]|uniref:ZIP zinc transporter-domain-containing protein n=1 Tax=Lipomyces chichibuensis TaxID=1546026 RepID=UPI00334374EC
MWQSTVGTRLSLIALLATTSMVCARVITESGTFDLEHIAFELQNCPVVKELDTLRSSTQSHESSWIQKAFAMIFPFGPGLNALLATAYISGPPNLILALIPPNIDPSSLSILVAFAVGGLLGDVFFHLMPQTFLGESHDPNHVRFVLVEEHRNSLLGLAIFFGFGAFIVLDKTMRIFGGDGEHNHSHSHTHSQSSEDEDVKAASSSVDKIADGALRNRKPSVAAEPETKTETETATKTKKGAEEEPGASVKLSAYLNLIADFSHNITDGLAIAASFYISQSVGATTTLAVFFHEIPHEVGDFALLIQGGFSKSKAMGAQFVTAIGAFLGTLIGIGIQYISTYESTTVDVGNVPNVPGSNGLFGTTCTAGELVLPFTAGGFLYIATVGVIPEILETDYRLTKFGEIKKGVWQTLAMLLGAGMMFLISWTEA